MNIRESSFDGRDLRARRWHLAILLIITLVAIIGVADCFASLAFVSQDTSELSKVSALFKLTISLFVILLIYHIVSNSRFIRVIYGVFSILVISHLLSVFMINLAHPIRMFGWFEIVALISILGFPYFVIRSDPERSPHLLLSNPSRLMRPKAVSDDLDCQSGQLDAFRKNQTTQSVNIQEPKNSGDGEALVAEEIEDERIDVELSPSDSPKEIIEGDGIRTEKIEQEEGEKYQDENKGKSLGKEMETSQEDAIKRLRRMAGLDEFVDNKNRQLSQKPPTGSSNFFDENMAAEFRPDLNRNNLKEYREKSQSEETLLKNEFHNEAGLDKSSQPLDDYRIEDPYNDQDIAVELDKIASQNILIKAGLLTQKDVEKKNK